MYQQERSPTHSPLGMKKKVSGASAASHAYRKVTFSCYQLAGFLIDLQSWESVVNLQLPYACPNM